jgi:L-threonylcarbamoyladenylate synthase
MCSASFQIHLAIRALEQGELIAYPTEAVYGLGCDPNNAHAIKKLLALKSRSANKGLILVASDMEQLEPWVDFEQIKNINALRESWPGHTTWLVPVKDQVSKLLSGKHQTLAVRVSAHPIVSQLCNHFRGAIVSTSANKSGMSAAKTCLGARKIFNQDIACYVPGDVSGNKAPSHIINAISGQRLR